MEGPMIKSMIDKVQSFRQRLFQLFHFRAGATLDLIDALAESAAESVAKVSLSPFFRRTYCSITDAIDNLFRSKAEQNPGEQELQGEHLKITQLLAEECLEPEQDTDCTAKPRIYANTVTDRSIVHTSNHIPGQKPITVGHEYSLVVFLPQNEPDRKLHWACPLSVQRVPSYEIGTQV